MVIDTSFPFNLSQRSTCKALRHVYKRTKKLRRVYDYIKSYADGRVYVDCINDDYDDDIAKDMAKQWLETTLTGAFTMFYCSLDAEEKAVVDNTAMFCEEIEHVDDDIMGFGYTPLSFINEAPRFLKQYIKACKY